MVGRLEILLPRLNERDRRLALASEARSWEQRTVTVHQATGDSKTPFGGGSLT